MVEDVLFADGSRDFASLNLGFLWIDDHGLQSLEDQRLPLPSSGCWRIEGGGWVEAAEGQGQVRRT